MRMRKPLGLAATVAVLAGAASAFAGQAGTDANGNFIDLNVAVSPPVAGTPKAPRGVGVSFDSFTGNRINGNVSPATSSIVVRFNKGFKDNGLQFPACKINPTALTKCPKATQIGTGRAEASIVGTNGAPPSFVQATLVAYNGKPLSGKAPTLIFVASVNGRPATELDFTAKQQPSGPYGLAFSSIQFPGAPASALSITKFSVTVPDQTVSRKVHGKRVKLHLIEAPTSCHGSWKFAQTNTPSNGAPLTATDSQPCTK
jgi:hypothetical protein